MYDLAVVSAIPSIQHGFLDEDFPWHQHEVWELHVFTGGEGRLLQGDNDWPVRAGSLTVSPPRIPHRIEVVDPMSFFYVQFDEDRETSKVLSRLMRKNGDTGPLKVDEALLSELSRVKTKLDSTDPDRVFSGIHAFRSWLFDLVSGLSERTPDQLDRALSWLREHLNERIRLDDWAAAVGMDRFGFCRRFKARTGQSPLAFVHRSKVEAASFLLAATELSLEAVAERLGFCDEFHFSRVFRKWRGVPPGQWRRGIAKVS